MTEPYTPTRGKKAGGYRLYHCANCRKQVTVGERDLAVRYNDRRCCPHCRHANPSGFIVHGTRDGYLKCRRLPDGACEPCLSADEFGVAELDLFAVSALIATYPDLYMRLTGVEEAA